MPRLVFIDDDETELQSFRDIVGGSYDCITVHWPRESTKLFTAPAPSIFVSDLYLPARTGDRTPTTEEREDAARAAKRVADRFDKLFEDQSRNDKARLKDSMEAIGCAYAMLGKQWRALGQSPDHGIVLLKELKTRYPEVPVVFYSRKITPEDVIRVLRAGAVDAIQKGAVEKQEVLARLATAIGRSNQ